MTRLRRGRAASLRRSSTDAFLGDVSRSRANSDPGRGVRRKGRPPNLKLGAGALGNGRGPSVSLPVQATPVAPPVDGPALVTSLVALVQDAAEGRCVDSAMVNMASSQAWRSAAGRYVRHPGVEDLLLSLDPLMRALVEDDGVAIDAAWRPEVATCETVDERRLLRWGDNVVWLTGCFYSPDGEPKPRRESSGGKPIPARLGGGQAHVVHGVWWEVLHAPRAVAVKWVPCPRDGAGPRKTASGGDGLAEQIREHVLGRRGADSPYVASSLGLLEARAEGLAAVLMDPAVASFDHAALRESLACEPFEDGPEPADTDRQRIFAAHVLRALKALDENHVAHRDLKRANLLLGTDGRVKVADFGTARGMDAHPRKVRGTDSVQETERGRQLSGSPASDLYALGIMLYECQENLPSGPSRTVQIAQAMVSIGEDRTLLAAPSDSRRSLIAALWAPRASRQSAEQLLLTHPFVCGVADDAVFPRPEACDGPLTHLPAELRREG